MKFIKSIAIAILSLGLTFQAANASTELKVDTGNKQKRVLLVMSSLDDMGISGKQTGTWFTELAAPYYILTEAGHEVVFASPEG